MFVCHLCKEQIPEPPPIIGQRPTARYVEIGTALASHLQKKHTDRVQEMIAGVLQFQTAQLYQQFECPAQIEAEMRKVQEHLRAEWLTPREPSPIVTAP